MNRGLLIALASATLTSSPLAVHAQDPVAIDATIGVSRGAGGRPDYDIPASVGAELVLGIRPNRAAAGMLAFTAGGSFKLGHGDTCRLIPGKSGCAPEFPDVSHFGLLAGVTRTSRGVTLRALVGPAFYSGSGEVGWGGEGFADVAAGLPRLALVAAVRGNYIARLNGERLRIGSLEFGLRLR